jgi:diacylglycerol O-acyltransferase
VLDAPRTLLNGALSAPRTFASATLSLDEVKAVKRACGVTVNDVVLAVVGGALRRVLSELDALPSRSLIAGVPIATDGPGDVRLGGNRVSNLFTTLGTDVADPIERLRAIHEVTAAAKTVQGLLGPEMMQEWVQFTPPGPYAWLVRQYSRFRVADRLPPPINAVVSNVPGSADDLVVAGARLLHLYSVGPILEGIGLNVTVWSYGAHLDVGILACPDGLADPARLAEGMRRELDELHSAAVGERTGEAAQLTGG